MIENKETAYCMAKLEDAIRAEYKSAASYLDCNDGKQDGTCKRMISRWSTKGRFKMGLDVIGRACKPRSMIIARAARALRGVSCFTACKAVRQRIARVIRIITVVT